MFLLLPLFVLGQTVNMSYKTLWEQVSCDTISNKIIIDYLDIYIQKAQIEKNLLEEHRAIDKKTEYVSNSEALILSNKALAIAKSLKNDSLIETSLLTKAASLFLNRNFKESLNYTLQAESYNHKTKDIYSLNSIRLDIGHIYYYIKDYEKAKRYILKAANYYKTKDEPAHIQSYVVSLYNLSKIYWQLNNIDSLQTTILEARKAIPTLESIDQIEETPYIDYVNGGLFFLQKKYSEAEKYFFKALPYIKKNNDFTNEHVVYLYQGKIYWNQNNKKKAIVYFEKVDQLFQNKKFLNYELREAYDYLITYYKETNQLQLQLQATENLIALNNQFEKEQQQLTNTLHYDLETKKLEESKAVLMHQLKNSKNTLTIGLIVAGLLCLILVGYIIWQYQQKKQWRLLYNTLISNAEQTIVSKNEEVITNTETAIDVNQPIINDNADKLSITELRILQGLELFETQKDFLNPIKLDDLATKLNTNRNTLSKLINVQKKANFNQYINRLRIKQVLVDLKNNKQLRKLSMQGLAETYGFANVKTFTTQFKTETQLTPAYFIEQLDFDDIQNAKIG